MSFLKVSGLVKHGRKDNVLKSVSFTLPQFKKLAIAGETGSGKSTLLKIIAGLLQADSGTVVLDGERLLGPAEKLVPGNPAVAYLSQHFELPHSLRVEQTLDYANVLSDEDAGLIFKVCRIDHLLQRRTDELSGGERQRIAIARLLVGAPRLLLLDEPYSNLDPVRKEILKSVIDDVGGQLGISCILVSHDPSDTLPWADEIMVMRGGEIVQSGTPHEIYFQPETEYVAGLFGFYSISELNASGRVRFLRPEQMMIVDASQGTIPGTVTRAQFFGSYYLMDVGVDGRRITVRHDTGMKTGENIHIKILKD